jgi:long-chain acyl-CoA synthetase
MSRSDHIRRTPLEDLAHWSFEQPDRPFLIECWTTHKLEISWKEAGEEVERAAAWLADRLGDCGGNRIGILSANSAHWILADLSIMASGNVTVPLFTTMDADTIQYVADFVELELLFLGPSDNWEQVRKNLPDGSRVIRLPGAPEVPGAIDWSEATLDRRISAVPRSPDADQLATIVFTSGTTGRPKGVMHSLSSMREAGYGVGIETGTVTDSRFLSYLPLAHLAERIVVEHNALAFGGTIYFNEGLATFLDDLRFAKPTWFLGVPRIWEKLQQAVFLEIASPEDMAAARKSGAFDAIRQDVREFLGLDQVEYVLTSTAPTAVPLKAWYDEMGIALHDGYGLSEILPISVSRKGQRKTGTIGQAGHRVEIRISDDGEIQARAPGTSMGYYKQPELTEKTFDADGWVHTGDKGYLDDDLHLNLTGRVKEIFKTSRGKYVAPAPIESVFLGSSLVEQVCLAGSGLAQTVMIVVLTEGARLKPETEISEELLNHTSGINQSLAKHERIGALVLSRIPWSQENGMLTHTLKMRRDQVEKHFAGEIEHAGNRMQTGEATFAIHIEP